MSPWDFGAAVEASEESSREQEAAETNLREKNTAYARAEEAYRKALALEMWRLRRQSVAWSTLGDLARGEENVATLKRERDEAEGEKLIASHAVFRRSSDRKDTEGLIEWSMRRELAEGYGR